MRISTGCAMMLVCCSGCTEYVGPPASPAYWHPKPAEANEDPSDPGPQAMVADTPAPTQTIVFLPEPDKEPAARPRPRSISLGFMGDGVLAGGITRDTVIEPRQDAPTGRPQSWQGYVNAPKWRDEPRARGIQPSWVRSSRGFYNPYPACTCPCTTDPSVR